MRETRESLVSYGNRKPWKGFKKRSDMISFVFWRDRIACNVERKLERSLIRGRMTLTHQVLNFYRSTYYSLLFCKLGIIISIVLMREIKFREI